MYLCFAKRFSKRRISLASGFYDVRTIIVFSCCFKTSSWCIRASQVVLVVKNPPASAGDVGDVGLMPGSGSSPGGGAGNHLQYSCLKNPMDGGAWRATVHRAARVRHD